MDVGEGLAGESGVEGSQSTIHFMTSEQGSSPTPSQAAC